MLKTFVTFLLRWLKSLLTGKTKGDEMADAFVERIAPAAQADWAKHQILPSLTLAQAIIESARGTSELATKANALFGIKASAPWTGKTYDKVTQEWDGSKYVSGVATFRAYDSWDASLVDHGEFLQKDRYAKVRGEKNYKLACQYIKDAGYATSPTYTQTLIDTIEKNNLTVYDSVVNEGTTMTDSALCSGYYYDHKKWNAPRNHVLDTLTPHHCAGNLTHQGMINILNGSRQMSPTYLIQTDGKIFQYVREANRSWCSSSAANDHRAVTIEVANDGGAPNWHISDAAMASLINLCEDVCRRNKIPKLNFTGSASGNLTMHKYFTPTACPGPYLESKFPEIAAEVNKRLASTPTPEEDTMNSTFLHLDHTKRNNQLFTTADPNGKIIAEKAKVPVGDYPILAAPVTGVAVLDTNWAKIAYGSSEAYAVYGGAVQAGAYLKDAKTVANEYGAPIQAGGGGSVSQEEYDRVVQEAAVAKEQAAKETERANTEKARADANQKILDGAKTIRVLES